MTTRYWLLCIALLASLAACSQNPEVPMVNGVPVLPQGWGGMQ